MKLQVGHFCRAGWLAQAGPGTVAAVIRVPILVRRLLDFVGALKVGDKEELL